MRNEANSRNEGPHGRGPKSWSRNWRRQGCQTNQSLRGAPVFRCSINSSSPGPIMRNKANFGRVAGGKWTKADMRRAGRCPTGRLRAKRSQFGDPAGTGPYAAWGPRALFVQTNPIPGTRRVHHGGTEFTEGLADRRTDKTSTSVSVPSVSPWSRFVRNEANLRRVSSWKWQVSSRQSPAAGPPSLPTSNLRLGCSHSRWAALRPAR